MRSKFIKIYKHDTSSAYLDLDFDKEEEIILNLEQLINANYKPLYPNGYGEYLPRLILTTLKDKIILIREDAVNAWKAIKEGIDEV